MRPLALCLALPLFAGAQNFDAVRDFIRRQLVETGAPSVAVAAARDGRIVWEEGFGWADRENRLAASAGTPYSLASISKPFTATALMILCQSGKVGLDQPVNRYLGGARLTAKIGDAAQATVRRVANHTSGLPLHYQFFYEDEPYRKPPMEESIRRYGILVRPPGEHYQYSNIGYGILDYLISRVSGKAYPDFMREEVFIPLGLTRTAVGIPPGLERQQAVRYGPDGLPLPFYDFDHPGGSAIYSSAHDLVRFGMFHLKAHLADQKAILSDETIERMQQPTAQAGGAGGADRGYGAGWFIEKRGGYRTVGHSGGMGGVATLLLLVPSEKIAVAVLTNTGGSLPADIAGQILAAMLPGFKAAPGAKSPEPKPFQPPAELAGDWKGNIETHTRELPLTLRIQPSGDIHVELAGQLQTLLNDADFQAGNLTGRFRGDIGTEDASRRPHFISLDVVLRGDTLNGAATAVSLPGRRAGNALTSWVELKRQR
jgi:CubicO group peptidase (beta-lactamase class C family)